MVFQSILCDKRSHVFSSELGGVSVHSQARYSPLDADPEKGHLTKEIIEKSIFLKNDLHTCATTIVSLENSLYGQILPFEEIKRIKEVTDKYNIHLHLDGARLWNVVVKTGVPLKEWFANQRKTVIFYYIFSLFAE